MKNILKKIINQFLFKFGFHIVRNRSVIPIEANNYEINLIKTCERYSMTGSIRMWALIQSLKYVAHNNLEGDLVECGVWKGGSLALMKLFSDHLGLSKKVVGFDTFEGMTDPLNIDTDYSGKSASQMMKDEPKDENITNIHAFASLEQVRKNISQVGIHNGVQLVKGKVEQSLLNLNNLPNKISILRLDTDWYESTKIELEILYPRLVPGGILIIDDYGYFEGARKAVDEYFKDKNVWLHYIDNTCRLVIK